MHARVDSWSRSEDEFSRSQWQGSVRRRELGERAGGTSSVASLVRVLDESRLKPKAKEQEVLDVATEYFLQHGYRGASINAMARSSGISKESIYRYFSSKQQLFEAVIGRELIEYRRSLHRLDATLRSMELRAALDHGCRDDPRHHHDRPHAWRCAG